MPGETVASLRFAHGGGRTFLQRQHVPYPFHITRPHALDSGHPPVATLILQSASGGLYQGDRLALDISAGVGARAWVTSQAATVVHRVAGASIGVRTHLDAASEACLVLATDPYILFPHTALTVQTDVTIAPGAIVILAEGFACHDPAATHRPFTRLAIGCRVIQDGRVLVDETGAIDGEAFLGPNSPLGRYRAMGTVMLLAAIQLDAAPIEPTLGALGVLGGITSLPNGAGLCVRLLAEAGGALARGLQAVVAAGFAAATNRPVVSLRR